MKIRLERERVIFFLFKNLLSENMELESLLNKLEFIYIVVTYETNCINVSK